MSSIYTPTVDWLIVFEDTDHGSMGFTEEDSAKKAFEMKAKNWNCHLFYRVSSESGIDYPKAEIQRLNQRIKELEQELKVANNED